MSAGRQITDGYGLCTNLGHRCANYVVTSLGWRSGTRLAWYACLM